MSVKSFFTELRRRHVVQVAVTYVIVAFVVLEGADIILPALQVPDWTLTVLVVLVVAGLPLAIVLAWAFELTPEGLRRDGPQTGEGGPSVSVAEPSESDGPQDVVQHDPRTSTSPESLSTGSRTSVAVLPFDNLSGDPDSDYFSDGVTEDILTHIASIGALRVISRTSALQYKGTKKNVREIAGELGVEHILEGTVRRAGSRVRITAQLIDALRDQHLWAETYDRELEDVFAVQSEVAEAVARALRAELAPHELERIRTEPTKNLEAYDLYLQGLHHQVRFLPRDLERAIQCHEAATRLDPAFTKAHADIVSALSALPTFGAFDPRTLLPRLQAAMETLRAADRDAPSLHGAQLWISMFYERDWVGAEVAWQRASASWDPSDESLVPPMILYLTLVERAVEADLVLRRALESNPFSTFLLAARAFVLPYLDRSEEGVASASAAIELDPEYWFAYPFRAIAHFYAGDPTAALSDLDRARELEPRVPFEQALRGVMLSHTGPEQAARDILAQLEDRSTREYVDPYYLFIVRRALGDVDGAIDILEQAIADGSSFYVAFIRAVPRYRSLREHPRFRALLARIWPDEPSFREPPAI